MVEDGKLETILETLESKMNHAEERREEDMENFGYWDGKCVGLFVAIDLITRCLEEE